MEHRAQCRRWLTGRATAPALAWGGGMLDGFHWTRVTSKQLRFLYEEITTLPPPPQMRELAEAIDRGLEALTRANASSNASNRVPEA